MKSTAHDRRPLTGERGELGDREGSITIITREMLSNLRKTKQNDELSTDPRMWFKNPQGSRVSRKQSFLLLGRVQNLERV